MGEHVKVFISYSHDSPAHGERVRALAERLQRNGILCALDVYEPAPPEGWRRWMERRIEESAFVLVVCTETYLRRFTGREREGVGLGARFECVLIEQDLYDAGMINKKFLPVLLDDRDSAYIPKPLRDYTHHLVDTDAGYEALLRHLTAQPEFVPLETGETPYLPPRKPALGGAAADRPPAPARVDPAAPTEGRRRSRFLTRGRAIGGIALLLAAVAAGWWSLRPRPWIDRTLPAFLMPDRSGPLPRDGRAARAYRDGLLHLAGFEVLQAKDDLERAVQIESAFPLAHAALAEAYLRVGRSAAASAEARAAVDRATSLPARERLGVQARYLTITGDWDRAVAAYRQLPGTLENGLAIVEAETAAGRGEAALEEVESLRRRFSDPRIDLAEAIAASEVPDYQRMLHAAERAQKVAAARGLDQLAANALLYHGIALFYRGDTPEAVAAFEKVRAEAAAGGDPILAAKALNAAAVALMREGKLAEAQQQYSEALKTYKDYGLGTPRDLADQENGLAAVSGDLGNLDEARTSLEAAAGHSREDEDPEGEARAMCNLGVILLREGKLDEAKKALDGAVGLVGGNESLLATVHFALGQLRSARGDLVAAADEHRTALVKRIKLHENGWIAESQLALARLSLDQGLIAQAEDSARAAWKEFKDEGVAHGEAEAQALLAEAALARNDPRAAETAAATAKMRVSGTEVVEARVAVELAEARVLAATGKAPEALRLAARLVAECLTKGLVQAGFKTRAVSGELELLHGDRGKGREILSALEREARSAGFRLVADKAAGRLAVPLPS